MDREGPLTTARPMLSVDGMAAQRFNVSNDGTRQASPAARGFTGIMVCSGPSRSD